MPDEFTSTYDTLEFQVPVAVPAPGQAAGVAVGGVRSLYERLLYELQHRENHKQVVRFLVVGVSGYVINLGVFAICIHLLGLDADWLGFADAPALVLGFVISTGNNFTWNRCWTFSATEDHPLWQSVRFFAVAILVFFVATGIYELLHGLGVQQKVFADGVSWIIATPLSFVLQKLWSFKA